MQVILLEKIRNLGKVGDVVTVKPGYGRNYLIPYGKCDPATPENMHKLEERQAELEKHAAELLTAAENRAEKLNATVITIPARASDEGKLYGSIGTIDIADAIQAQGLEVSKSEVLLPKGPIRQLGEYDIDLQLHSDVTATVKVEVVAEK